MIPPTSLNRRSVLQQAVVHAHIPRRIALGLRGKGLRGVTWRFMGTYKYRVISRVTILITRPY